MEQVLLYFEQYGAYFLFLFVFLEYLKLPIIPSGVILPAAGMMVAREKSNLVGAVAVSLVAGLIGSLSSYTLGYYLGNPILEKACERSKRVQKLTATTYDFLERYGDKGLSLIRLIPVARTLVSMVAGTIQLKLIPFMFYSAVGILIWNLVYITLGYLFANRFL